MTRADQAIRGVVYIRGVRQTYPKILPRRVPHFHICQSIPFIFRALQNGSNTRPHPHPKRRGVDVDKTKIKAKLPAECARARGQRRARRAEDQGCAEADPATARKGRFLRCMLTAPHSQRTHLLGQTGRGCARGDGAAAARAGGGAAAGGGGAEGKGVCAAVPQDQVFWCVVVVTRLAVD